MSIQVFPLGAGQDVGRSCIILKILDKCIMLDCGLHMGITDSRKFPDFSLLPKENFNVDLVLVTHFHLDHCGALPAFTEKTDFKGPVLMTQPTKCLFPYMCEDFIRVIGMTSDLQTYTSEDILSCLRTVQTIELHETKIIDDIKIKCYYAGHVLGACMFSISYKDYTVVYTGDFNSSSDRHLGAAWIDKLRPDLLITESTYATTVRESKRSREKEFLSVIQSTIDNGGKVLIPVFAVGRAQELCILLETYWARKGNKQGVYFSGGLIDKANFFYKIFLEWTNENIKSNFLTQFYCFKLAISLISSIFNLLKNH